MCKVDGRFLFLLILYISREVLFRERTTLRRDNEEAMETLLTRKQETHMGGLSKVVNAKDCVH